MPIARCTSSYGLWSQETDNLWTVVLSVVYLQVVRSKVVVASICTVRTTSALLLGNVRTLMMGNLVLSSPLFDTALSRAMYGISRSKSIASLWLLDVVDGWLRLLSVCQFRRQQPIGCRGQRPAKILKQEDKAISLLLDPEGPAWTHPMLSWVALAPEPGSNRVAENNLLEVQRFTDRADAEKTIP